MNGTLAVDEANGGAIKEVVSADIARRLEKELAQANKVAGRAVRMLKQAQQRAASYANGIALGQENCDAVYEELSAGYARVSDELAEARKDTARLDWIIREIVIYRKSGNQYYLIGDDESWIGRSTQEPPPMIADFAKYTKGAIDAAMQEASK